jgi:hypothetical protein
MFHWPASFAESASSVFVRLAESMVFANGSIETDRRAVYSRKMVDKLHSCRRTTKLKFEKKKNIKLNLKNKSSAKGTEDTKNLYNKPNAQIKCGKHILTPINSWCFILSSLLQTTKTTETI